jgi:exopolyphosphatase/guanosine-5'-triphosphate,3'-diphosphate pyrophosphatase
VPPPPGGGRALSASHFGPVAVIDIGASAVRLNVANIARGQPPEILEEASRGLLIGRDTFSEGIIRAETIEAAVVALEGFRHIMESYGAIMCRTVATSAVREAANADIFIDRVRVRTGLDVEIIDGAEESRLTYLAIRERLRSHPAAEAEHALLLEVGGGSLVVTRLDRLQPRQSGVYPLGAIRLRQSLASWHGRHDQRVALLARHVANVVADVARDLHVAGTTAVIALGSDIRFVVNQLIDVGDEGIAALDRGAFLGFCAEVIAQNEDSLVDRYRLPQVSAETLVPALLVYRDLLLQTNASQLIVPDVSLRAGVLVAMAGAAAEPALDDYDAHVLAGAQALGEKYRYDAPHAQAVARLSCRIFDEWRAEHALARHDRLLLQVAALLHDVGSFVSVRSHHKHTQYLIEASEIFGLTRDDMRVVANVARYHRRAQPEPTHLSYMMLSRPDRVRVQKLGALLRLANALDAEHLQKIRDVKLTSQNGTWVLMLEGTGDLTMERLVAASRADMLTSVFGRPVIVQGAGVS